jgi:hypothetical protein
MQTQAGKNAQAKLREVAGTGPITAATTDDAIKARAQMAAYSAGVNQQVLEHLFFLERRISRLESAPHLAAVETR